MKKLKNIIVQFSILFIIWMLINNTFDLQIVLTGVIISMLISVLFCLNCEVLANINLTPKAFIYTILFIFVFLIELIKSNFDVALRVLKPSLPINPGIVEVKTRLASKMGRMILANSITLTPGTFTIDIKDDILFIHWIDVKSTDINKATQEIVSKFEKYLEVIYG